MPRTLHFLLVRVKTVISGGAPAPIPIGSPEDMDNLEIRPLTARSVVLSTLLGVHPPRLPARHLVRVGDLVHSGGAYALTARLLERQARQDESRLPPTVPWDGTWEIAVITAERRPAADRAALRQAMSALRLAELREGTWLRPANLTRTRPDTVVRQCTFLSGRPEEDPVALAASLWDLRGWASKARRPGAAANRPTAIAERFTLAAAVLRHLVDDPLLPPSLLPRDWPGPGLREDYERFKTDFEQLLTNHVLL